MGEIQRRVQEAIGLIEASIQQGVPLTPADTETILNALKSAQNSTQGTLTAVSRTSSAPTAGSSTRRAHSSATRRAPTAPRWLSNARLGMRGLTGNRHARR
jgi:hypothetical protein